jgi:hypothetical protein
VNYLHHGQALDLWPDHLPEWEGPVAKLDLLRHLHSRLGTRSGMNTLVRGYFPLAKEISLGEFRQALCQSMEWRRIFHALGCRGFSYELDAEMKEYNRQYVPSCRLGTRINLRVALMPNIDLFYPPAVKRWFRRASWYFNHYVRNHMPSIAFCLGLKTGDAWFVFVMQSDLASGRPACVREHFRGWRNVLFANVVAQAQGKAGAVYISRALDVERACSPGSKEAGRLPDRWRSIYDGTALQWGMPLVKLSEPVDVQIYGAKKPVYSEYFYELRLHGRPEVSQAEQQEALCTGTP